MKRLTRNCSWARLTALDIAIDKVVVNKVRSGNDIDAIHASFVAERLLTLPLADSDFVGAAAFKAYLQAHGTAFAYFRPSG